MGYLANNLIVTPASLEAIGAKSLLLDFILHHHLNIEWYERRIAEEQLRQRGFFWGSVSLLLVIPAATFAISYFAPADAPPTLLAAQLTAVLTGIIGFQSALRSLFEKRNVITLFHKASSSLKKAVYDFEGRWAGCVPDGSRNETEAEVFKANLRNAIRKARDVEAEEREAYFASQAEYPLLDLRGLLSEAGLAASEIVGRHAKGSALRGLRAVDVAASAHDLGSRVDALRAKLTVLRANASRTADAEQLQIVEQEIAATKKQLNDAQQALLAAAARRFDALP